MRVRVLSIVEYALQTIKDCMVSCLVIESDSKLLMETINGVYPRTFTNQ